MKLDSFGREVGVLIVALAAGGWPRAATAQTATSPDARSHSTTASADRYSHLEVGLSTKADVRALLGEPWRTVLYNDDVDVHSNEIWEYRGSDAGEPYRVHIEFDQHGVVAVAAKVADRAAAGQGLPAKPRVGPDKN